MQRWLPKGSLLWASIAFLIATLIVCVLEYVVFLEDIQDDQQQITYRVIQHLDDEARLVRAIAEAVSLDYRLSRGADQAEFEASVNGILEVADAGGIRAVAVANPLAADDVEDRWPRRLPDWRRFPGSVPELVPPSDDAWRYPAHRVAPEAGNERVIGFDLWADPVRRAAAEIAIETDELVGSAPVILSQDSETPIASMLLVRTVEDPRWVLPDHASGFIAIGYSPPLDEIIQLAADLMGGVEIVDESADGMTVLVPNNRSGTSIEMATTVDTINFLGRPWRITVTTSLSDLSAQAVVLFLSFPVLVGLAAFIFTSFVLRERTGRRYLTGIVSEQEHRLRKQNRDLEESLRAQNDAVATQHRFLQNMSHDFRTPLNAILGISEAMELGVFGENAPRKPVEYWRDTRHAAQQLKHLVDTLFFVNEIDGGILAVEKVPIQLQKAVNNALSTIISANPKASRLLSASVEPTVWVTTDGTLLERILINLIDNALKYAPGRQIDVSAHRRSDGKGVLTVRDYGPGIPDESMKRIFERFNHRRSSHVSGPTGLGLGLSISADLAEKLGHQLTILNHRDGGVLASILFERDADPA